MNITIINDCRDENAKGRQMARVNSLFHASANFIGVSSELEAAGNLIDALDAHAQGIVLVNVAPRGGAAKRHFNGTPFGYFWHGQTLVVASIDGLTLSLVKKLNLASSLNVLSVPESVAVLRLPPALKKHIINTQFRSYEYLPRIAAYLYRKNHIKSRKMAMREITDAPQAIWWIDNFGNCKTTLLEDEFKKLTFKKIFKKVPYLSRLKDVPNKKAAFITGSSGIGHNRFLELVVQGGNAAKKFGVTSGDRII